MKNFQFHFTLEMLMIFCYVYKVSFKVQINDVKKSQWWIMQSAL